MKLNNQCRRSFSLPAVLIVTMLGNLLGGFGQSGLPARWGAVTAIAAGGKRNPALQNCAITISSSSQTFVANGGAASVSITTSNDCFWQVTNNSPSLITLTGASSGLGNGSVSFTVSPNPASTSRSGTITINSATFTVWQGAPFADVLPNHPFATEIAKLSAAGVTLGCGNGNFCPDSSVTREQMAALLSRALDVFNPPLPGAQRFTDVPPTHLFYAYIEEIARRQITLGCGGGNYCPAESVTRQQMAAFIIRALHEPGYLPPAPNGQRFTDVPPSNLFYAHIEELAQRGITLGCGGGNFCPTDQVTRAQVAAFLVRAFALPNSAPTVAITAPANGASFTVANTITFTTTAMDAEDGNLSTGVVWTAAPGSDPTAALIPLGTGASVTTTTLAPNTYLITARATDSGNRVGSAQIVITIAPCAVVANLQPGEGLRIPQLLQLDATRSNDTCRRPLKYYWKCQSDTSIECPNFLTLANGNDNSNPFPTILLLSTDVIVIELRVCAAGTNECAPWIFRVYEGAAVND